MQKANPYGEVSEADALDGVCYQVLNEERKQLGAFVLCGQGSECWIQAAAGSASVNLSVIFDDLIEKHAKNFKTIAFRTYRKGLVKNAQKLGYFVEEQDQSGFFIMRKTRI